MNTPKLICFDCRRSRKTASGKIICTSIGLPELALRYGKCRRFEARAKRTDNPNNNQPNLFD